MHYQTLRANNRNIYGPLGKIMFLSIPMRKRQFIFLGPLLICKRGVLVKNSVERENIDKEFVVLFTEMNENESWLLDDNIDSFSDDPAATKALKSDAGFIASNKMKSINGYVYGNLPGLNMCQGDRVSWHMIGMGTWSDVHNRKYF